MKGSAGEILDSALWISGFTGFICLRNGIFGKRTIVVPPGEHRSSRREIRGASGEKYVALTIFDPGGEGSVDEGFFWSNATWTQSNAIRSPMHNHVSSVFPIEIAYQQRPKENVGSRDRDWDD